MQRAQTIAVLLPVENVAVACELATTNGLGVLWVLDGWDELSGVANFSYGGAHFRK